MPGRAVVTGAFSYIGSAVATELVRRGWQVHTLTRRSRPAEAGHITTAPLTFEMDHLVSQLTGADLFVNTYWIRLPHGGQTFETAVANNRLLVEAAKRAGVGRYVHVSVSNASLDSELGYYRGKALTDEAVRGSGLSHAIVRPTLVVGPSDVLTSNIAWCLRRFPLFGMPGGGRCRLQPVTLADTGRIVADAGEAEADLDVDAAGPDVVTFADYVRTVARVCGLRRWIVPVPGWLALGALWLVEPFVGDVILTREELAGLDQELLVSHAPPLGAEPFEPVLERESGRLGRSYVNDIHRHFGAGSSEPILTPEKTS
jgi:uncharacterized protein YbjT (DUF2867 family)